MTAIAVPPRVAGVISDPRFWASSAGWDFRAVFGHADLRASAGASNDGINAYGWVVSTGAAFVEGSIGDFASSGDHDPTRIAVAVAGDTIVSPRIFGSYAHALQASYFLGGFPTKLNWEAYARWSSIGQNQTGTFLGFAHSSVVNSNAAGSAAVIRTDASVFRLNSDLGDDAGAAKDTAWHLFKVSVGLSTTEWWIDGVSQGTITTEADIWPQQFRVYTDQPTQDDIEISRLRIWYEL